MNRLRAIGRGVFAAAVACALGAGATQAFAGPPAAAERATCVQFQCHRNCVLNYHAQWGQCTDGVCECWYDL